MGDLLGDYDGGYVGAAERVEDAAHDQGLGDEEPGGLPGDDPVAPEEDAAEGEWDSRTAAGVEPEGESAEGGSLEIAGASEEAEPGSGPGDSQAESEPVGARAESEADDAQAESEPVGARAESEADDAQAESEPVGARAETEPDDAQAESEPVRARAKADDGPDSVDDVSDPMEHESGSADGGDDSAEGEAGSSEDTGGSIDGGSGGDVDEAADEAAPAVPGVGADVDEAGPSGRVVEIALPDAAVEALTGALAALRDSVINLRFGLDLPGAEEAQKAKNEIIAQIGDYVIPRVRMAAAPVLVVVAGSTGAGKSTLVNTLAGQKVSATGVRRPTTAVPVLACHPDDHEWFSGDGLLPELARLTDPAAPVEGENGALVVAPTERLPHGVALLDTPDIDSVVEEHHEIAHRMLDAADLWIFVTTAARYADAPAWRLLRLAKERGAKLAIVLSRVPPRSREIVLKHFVRMLTEYGLGEVDRFVVDEGAVSDGLLKDTQVAELRMWLAELSVDEERRAEAVQATLNGVLNSFRSRIPALARHVEAQVTFRAEVRGDVDAAYMAALAEIDEMSRNGSLLRGEALARWQDFAGSGDLKRTLRLRKPGRFAGKAVQQGPERLGALKSSLKSGLESVIVSAAHRASEEVVARWLHRNGTGELLSANPGLDRPSEEFVRKVSRSIGAWQDHVVELMRTEGVTKRSVARVISYDLESLSLIFTVGLLGYGTSEVKAEGSAGTLPQRLLRAVLGAESLRGIGAKARSDLRARISMLFDEEALRYVQALDASGVPDETAATRLYQATYQLEVAR
ncbi:dynamin family protein [Sinosporangium siamense]|uniref:dynamin family protein n=1 Tax=Sinosporangium siamense TaxID=1367973 RepID=UPI0035E5D54B